MIWWSLHNFRFPKTQGLLLLSRRRYPWDNKTRAKIFFPPSRLFVGVPLFHAQETFGKRLGDFAWPDRDEFDYVARVWPAEKEMKRQFLVLSLILRLNKGRQHWYKVSGYLLSLSRQLDPLVSMTLGACLTQPGFRRAKPEELFVIKQRIWRFLTPVRAGSMFEASTDSLGKLGQKSRFKQLVTFGKDSAAVFTKKPFKDRIVMVEQVLQDHTLKKTNWNERIVVLV